MESESHACEPVDPLAGYWGLSLFPQTSCALPDPSIPYDPDEDLQFMHNHLRSTVLQNPSKFLNEAKSIVDRDMNSLNFDNQAYQLSHQGDENSEANAQENHRERRPGLARKRARFSLKPNSSNPLEGLEQNLDIGELKDPVKFFTAFEQIDNAKREIQKQMGGVSFDSNQHRAARQRRPGILGKNQRRPAKYKHLYSLEASGDELVSSQEVVELSSLSPVNQVSQGTIEQVSSHGEELETTDSSAVGESKLDEIIGELLHQKFEGADDDLAFNILQEKLQVKPIVVEKLSFPDLPDNRMFNMKSSGHDVSRPRKALVNIDSVLNGMFHETFMKSRLKDDKSLHNLASPTPPKSPFSPLSLLQKRKSKAKASAEAFSIFDSDHMSSGNSCRADKLNNKSDITDSGNLFGSSDNLNSPAINEGVALQGVNFIEEAGGELAQSSEKLVVEHNISEPAASINVSPSRCDAKMKQNFGGWITDEAVSDEGVPIEVNPSSSNTNMEESVRGYDTNEVLDRGEDPINADCDMLTVNVDKNVGGCDREDELCNEDAGTCDQSSKRHASDEKDPNVHEAENFAAPCDLDQNLRDPQDQSSFDQVEAQKIDECMNPEDSVQEQHVEVTEKVLEITIDEQMKPKLHPRGKGSKKENSRRQSLAGAGTCLKAGLRRSTRMRTRPLEFWKGEKLVYGRIHSSLPTVIGMKYASPGKQGGEPTLKVKSFVSEEYKELLERASYY